MPTQVNYIPPKPMPVVMQTIEKANSPENLHQQQPHKFKRELPENIQTHRQQTEDYYRSFENTFPHFQNNSSGPSQYPKIHPPQTTQFSNFQEQYNPHHANSSQNIPLMNPNSTKYPHQLPQYQSHNPVQQNKNNHGRELARGK
ncbi:hypothetical protein GcC1_006031 [Golovinomyces cichoracearum]|uniref:Uncharacterized protein n=1 Tax=Golovinomyces cichoracearum TaxID=62708 RepID=A0A420J8I0_9PEZI|nr:hypothetical protein GcC1_006031 [Golovinomyces cichoracearum]